MEEIAEPDLMGLLSGEIEKCGGIRPLAREWGVSPSVISDTLSRRRPFPRTLAALLGYREVPRRWRKLQGSREGQDMSGGT